jgi:FlaA1/EpsC-like NDP-sugar epimerase
MGKRIYKIIGSVFKTTPFKRKAFFFTTDIILISFSMYISFWLRFDGDIPSQYLRGLWLYILLAVLIKILYLALHGLYGITWRFFSLRETIRLFQAVTFATLTLGLLIFLLKIWPVFQQFPRSVLLLDYNFTIGLIGSLRISKRAIRELMLRRKGLKLGRTRALIIGAGSAGEQIAREMLNSRRSTYSPVGFIDDDPAKQKVEIQGAKVLGTRADLPRILDNIGIDEVLVAIPSANSREIRNIIEIVRSAQQTKKIKILPGIHDLMEGNITLSDIKEVEVEDLLGREPVQIDFEAICKFIKGKRVLVTGGGGSIGGELARTILQFDPKMLVLLDNDETELFYVMNRLKKTGSELWPVIGNVTDRAKMNKVFERIRPDVVIHSAALKHVPILEYYPEEAVKTNVLGTRILAEAALRIGVERFIYISTDKAINPTSVMGATKRVGEEMLRTLNVRNGTRFISVRFGNVLGSRGSVIPLFKEQIRRGGPVTVTHPNVKRYFMAPSEAVLLILEAASLGIGGEAYILDMGEPIKIDDLARDMIRLSGFEPDVDIPIVYTGLRAGEKLFEELLGAEEGSEPTEHAMIFRARNSKERNVEELWENVDRLIECCSEGDCRKENIASLLKKIVPTYNPDNSQSSIFHW